MLKNARLNHINILLLITVQPVFVGRKINQDPKEEEESHRLKFNNALFIVFNVTCVMQVMWAIRADTYIYIPYINTTKTNMARSLKT